MRVCLSIVKYHKKHFRDSDEPLTCYEITAWKESAVFPETPDFATNYRDEMSAFLRKEN